jgi:hypothetical protein
MVAISIFQTGTYNETCATKGHDCTPNFCHKNATKEEKKNF